MTSNGATPASSTVTTTDTTGVSPKALRVWAGIGVVLLAPVWILCMLLTLVDAHDGKGVAGPLVDAGFTALWPSFFLGVIAMAVPRDAMKPQVRVLFTGAQYILMLLAPLLIALDGNA